MPFCSADLRSFKWSPPPPPPLSIQLNDLTQRFREYRSGGGMGPPFGKKSLAYFKGPWVQDRMDRTTAAWQGAVATLPAQPEWWHVFTDVETRGPYAGGWGRRANGSVHVEPVTHSRLERMRKNILNMHTSEKPHSLWCKPGDVPAVTEYQIMQTCLRASMLKTVTYVGLMPTQNTSDARPYAVVRPSDAEESDDEDDDAAAEGNGWWLDTAVERFNSTGHADASQVVTITVGPVFGTKEPEMVAKVVLFLDPSTLCRNPQQEKFDSCYAAEDAREARKAAGEPEPVYAPESEEE